MSLKESFNGIRHSFVFPSSTCFRAISVTVYCTSRQVLKLFLLLTVLPDFRLEAVWKKENGGEEGLHHRWESSAPPHLAPRPTWMRKGHRCHGGACGFGH